MNDTSSSAPEPEPVENPQEPVQEPTDASIAHAPTTAAKLTITTMFIVLSLAGAWTGWIVQTDFVRKSTPNAPSGMPGQGQVDSEFTLEFHGVELKGFDVIMSAMGVPAKQSTFNVLLNSSDLAWPKGSAGDRSSRWSSAQLPAPSWSERPGFLPEASTPALPPSSNPMTWTNTSS